MKHRSCSFFLCPLSTPKEDLPKSKPSLHLLLSLFGVQDPICSQESMVEGQGWSQEHWLACSARVAAESASITSFLLIPQALLQVMLDSSLPCVLLLVSPCSLAPVSSCRPQMEADSMDACLLYLVNRHRKIASSKSARATRSHFTFWVTVPASGEQTEHAKDRDMGRSVETSILPVMLIRKQCVTEVKWKYKSVFIPGLCSSLDTWYLSPANKSFNNVHTHRCPQLETYL